MRLHNSTTFSLTTKSVIFTTVFVVNKNVVGLSTYTVLTESNILVKSVFSGRFLCVSTVIRQTLFLTVNVVLFTLFFHLVTEQVGVDPFTDNSLSLKSDENTYRCLLVLTRGS